MHAAVYNSFCAQMFFDCMHQSGRVTFMIETELVHPLL